MSTHFRMLKKRSHTHLVVNVLNVLKGGGEERTQTLGVLLSVGVQIPQGLWAAFLYVVQCTCTTLKEPFFS